MADFVSFSVKTILNEQKHDKENRQHHRPRSERHHGARMREDRTLSCPGFSVPISVIQRYREWKSPRALGQISEEKNRKSSTEWLTVRHVSACYSVKHKSLNQPEALGEEPQELKSEASLRIENEAGIIQFTRHLPTSRLM